MYILPLTNYVGCDTMYISLELETQTHGGKQLDAVANIIMVTGVGFVIVLAIFADRRKER